MGVAMTDEELSELSRRAFLKRMAVVGFAVPIVTSFALDGVASARPTSRLGNQSRFGNQIDFPPVTFPNQANQEFIDEFADEIDEILGQLLPNQTD
jgi:hypothetical protein